MVLACRVPEQWGRSTRLFRTVRMMPVGMRQRKSPWGTDKTPIRCSGAHAALRKVTVHEERGCTANPDSQDLVATLDTEPIVAMSKEIFIIHVCARRSPAKERPARWVGRPQLDPGRGRNNPRHPSHSYTASALWWS